MTYHVTISVVNISLNGYIENEYLIWPVWDFGYIVSINIDWILLQEESSLSHQSNIMTLLYVLYKYKIDALSTLLIVCSIIVWGQILINQKFEQDFGKCHQI